MGARFRAVHQLLARRGRELRSTRGATSTEYAILLVLLVVVIVLSVRFFGDAVFSLFRTYPELISS